MKRYLIKVGNGAQPPVRVSTLHEVGLYLSGLLVGDGRGTERASGITEVTMEALADGSQYLDTPAFLLVSDDRPVYIWTEGNDR